MSAALARSLASADGATFLDPAAAGGCVATLPTIAWPPDLDRHMLDRDLLVASAAVRVERGKLALVKRRSFAAWVTV